MLFYQLKQVLTSHFVTWWILHARRNLKLGACGCHALYRVLCWLPFNNCIACISGGQTGTEEYCTAAVERYDPATNRWSEIQPLNKPRCEHGAAVVHGRIYVFGG